MDTQRFNILLHRYLNDQATEQERIDLMLLIDNDEYTEDLKKTLQEYYGKDPLIFENEHQELQRILEKAKARDQAIPTPESLPAYRHWWLAAAATIAFVIASTYIVLDKIADKKIASQHSNEYKIFKGKQLVVLPDGSSVTMNENSELTYHESYGEHLREVTLKGEAYFKVKPDKLHAFVVHTGNVRSHVLGTEFNVNSFNKDVVVTVYRGKVQVLDNMREVGVITPNQQIAVDQSTHHFKKADVNAESFLTWKNNYLIMDNITMQDAAQMIEKKFNVEVELANEAMKNCIVKLGFFNNEDLSEVLTVMSAMSRGTCLRKGDKVVLTGEGCK